MVLETTTLPIELTGVYLFADLPLLDVAYQEFLFGNTVPGGQSSRGVPLVATTRGGLFLNPNGRQVNHGRGMSPHGPDPRCVRLPRDGEAHGFLLPSPIPMG